MVQRKAGSGGVLRSVDDTCHGSRSTQNRKPAFLVLRTSGTTPSRQPHQSGRSPPLLPSFFLTRQRQAYRSASPLLPAVQSGRRHCEIRSMRQQFPTCILFLTSSLPTSLDSFPNSTPVLSTNSRASLGSPQIPAHAAAASPQLLGSSLSSLVHSTTALEDFFSPVTSAQFLDSTTKSRKSSHTQAKQFFGFVWLSVACKNPIVRR